MESKVVTMLLTNGNPIIGQLIFSSEEVVVLQEPRLMMLSPKGIALVKILLTDEERVTFHRNNLLTDPVSASGDLVSEYLSTITSLVVPKTKLKM